MRLFTEFIFVRDMGQEKVVIIMGSGKDQEFSEYISSTLDEFEISYDTRVASAHKTPRKLLSIVEEYENEEGIVFITVAGRSNALSGFVDANTIWPVIACPPYSDKFGGADIFSSLRMPSGVGPLVLLDPESAALAAAKILALQDEEIYQKVSYYQKKAKDRVLKSDEEVSD